MIATVRRAREEIAMKLDTARRVTPGTFIRPLGKLRKKGLSTAPGTARSADDQVKRFLEKQNQANNEVWMRGKAG